MASDPEAPPYVASPENHSTNQEPLNVESTVTGPPYSYSDAIWRTAFWVSAACLFGAGVWITKGRHTGEEFFAGYLIEYSLSVDNLFVFLMLFRYFKVPLASQPRVLTWGILGAIVLRGSLIAAGAAILQHFQIVLLLFASILLYSSLKFFASGSDDDDEEEDLSQNTIVRMARYLFPATDHFDKSNFFTTQDGIRKATPLFICMVTVELSDVVFAVDSIPAVFGITNNPLIVFTSNMFAILGLRSLFAILSKAASDLKYLETAVAAVLGFVGLKMIAGYFGFTLENSITLAVVAVLLGVGVGASLWEKRRNRDSSALLPEIRVQDRVVN